LKAEPKADIARAPIAGHGSAIFFFIDLLFVIKARRNFRNAIDGIAV
jgi:hypothetical protein